MNRRQTYYFIGNLLSRISTPGKHEQVKLMFKSEDFNWPLFIAMGSNNLVLQTIYCKLLEDGLTVYLPDEINSHLKQIYNLNYKRNTEILQQVYSINSLLNEHHIIPLYMKGVGNIIDGLYTNPAERIMHDIDILLPEEEWEIAVQIFLQNGYLELNKYNPDNRIKIKHYPPLYKPGTKATVEIHRLPVDYTFSQILTTKEIWADKKLITHYGKCYVMSDHHKIIHNFVHSQLVHNGHRYARVLLRNLFDLYLLSLRADSELYLKNLSAFKQPASGYLRIMQKLFGENGHGKTKIGIKSRLFLFRFETNLRSRLIGLITFLVPLLFNTYILIPLRSINDKELRNSLPKKIFNRNWYKRHYKSIKRIYKTDSG